MRRRITQGTGTIEETAFFLDLYHGHDQPMTVADAMRTSTMPCPDGPANLYAAVIAAADPCLSGAGAQVVPNNEIRVARQVREAFHGLSASTTSPSASWRQGGRAPRQPVGAGMAGRTLEPTPRTNVRSVG
ncbi:asparaginase domain-containing protein [Streptomyces sporangiiformans]|uniref:asparaginase domain-containing protein n=1 Tax=Streptomyces sporangiiformans TaxID=2315329 RepID=UPI0013C46C61|nr:asparaginase domain-containing protein [Streptomyces sporangiiformans]